MRTDHEAYRRGTDERLSRLAAELRGERAEKEEVKAENRRLTERVKYLEDEVRRLKNNQP